MNKIFFSAALIAVMGLASCGKSACDCLKETEELMGKIAKDPSKAEDYKKEADELEKDCKDYKEEDFKECK
ncbi:MAG: hypothetical protein ACKO6J_00805 [Crocinitomicaceae bacterium]